MRIFLEICILLVAVGVFSSLFVFTAKLNHHIPISEAGDRFEVWVDSATGCQYLMPTVRLGSPIPRLNDNGRIICDPALINKGVRP